MTTAKLAFEELTNPGARPRQRKFREVDFTPPHDLPVVDLIELYTGIEFALPTNQGLVVQFVAATSSRDNEQVALDMAWAAASALHKRVLVLTLLRGRAAVGRCVAPTRFPPMTARG